MTVDNPLSFCFVFIGQAKKMKKFLIVHYLSIKRIAPLFLTSVFESQNRDYSPQQCALEEKKPAVKTTAGLLGATKTSNSHYLHPVYSIPKAASIFAKRSLSALISASFASSCFCCSIVCKYNSSTFSKLLWMFLETFQRPEF